jgi:cell division protein FtsL
LLSKREKKIYLIAIIIAALVIIAAVTLNYLFRR